MRLKTTNRNKRKALRRIEYVQGFLFHQQHVAKLWRTGKLLKLNDTRFARKLRRAEKIRRASDPATW